MKDSLPLDTILSQFHPLSPSQPTSIRSILRYSLLFKIIQVVTFLQVFLSWSLLLLLSSLSELLPAQHNLTDFTILTIESNMYKSYNCSVCCILNCLLCPFFSALGVVI